MLLRFAPAVTAAIALVCALLLPLRAEARDPETMAILKDRAENFIQCMLRGSVNSIVGEMHPTLRQTYTAEVVQNIFADLHYRGGRFQETGETTLALGRNHSVIATIPLHYTNQSVSARIVFERAGRHSRIYEFAILPYTEQDPSTLWRDPDAPPPPPRALPSPPYVNSLLYRVDVLKIEREGLDPLSARLYTPHIATESSPVPAVILLADPSPTGNLPMVGSSSPIRDIAEGLATRGVAAMVVVPDIVKAASPADNSDHENNSGEEQAEEVAADDEPVNKQIARSLTPEFWANAEALLQSRPTIDINRVTLLHRDFQHTHNAFVGAGVTFERVVASMPEMDWADSGSTRGTIFLRSSTADAGNAANIVSYSGTGPYLLETVEEGDTTRYTHVVRSVIDDVARFARTGRMPNTLGLDL